MKEFLYQMKEQLKNGYLRQFKEKFEEEYLHVEKDGKLCERVVLRRIAAAVISILFCMSAMGFSAYAFFTSNVASESNKIEAAGYQAEYTVMKEEDVLTQLSGITYPTYQLESGIYQVTITIPETVTASKGYCKMIVGSRLEQNENGETVIADAVEYYTCSLAPGETLTFTIQNYESAAVVRFIANWGSCSVTDEEKLVERPEPGTEETVETITFGTAPNMLDVGDEPSEDTPQTDGAAQPVADSEESSNNLDEMQSDEAQDNSASDDATGGDEGDVIPTDGATNTIE